MALLAFHDRLSAPLIRDLERRTVLQDASSGDRGLTRRLDLGHLTGTLGIR